MCKQKATYYANDSFKLERVSNISPSATFTPRLNRETLLSGNIMTPGYTQVRVVDLQLWHHMHITPRVSHPLSGNLSVSVFFFPLPLKRNLLLEPSKKKKINGHRFSLHSEGRESKSRGKGDKTTGKQGKQLGYSVRAVMSIQTWWFIRRDFGLCVYEDYIFKKYTSRD